MIEASGRWPPLFCTRLRTVRWPAVARVISDNYGISSGARLDCALRGVWLSLGPTPATPRSVTPCVVNSPGLCRAVGPTAGSGQAE
jgi:hypothetical protein